jgi:hypothetical protein
MWSGISAQRGRPSLHQGYGLRATSVFQNRIGVLLAAYVTLLSCLPAAEDQVILDRKSIFVPAQAQSSM